MHERSDSLKNCEVVVVVLAHCGKFDIHPNYIFKMNKSLIAKFLWTQTILQINIVSCGLTINSEYNYS